MAEMYWKRHLNRNQEKYLVRLPPQLQDMGWYPRVSIILYWDPENKRFVFAKEKSVFSIPKNMPIWRRKIVRYSNGAYLTIPAYNFEHIIRGWKIIKISWDPEKDIVTLERWDHGHD